MKKSQNNRNNTSQLNHDRKEKIKKSRLYYNKTTKIKTTEIAEKRCEHYLR